MRPAITGVTDLFLIAADPIAQVRAPELFNAIFDHFSIDAVMVPTHVSGDHIESFVRSAFHVKNLKGILLSIPNKSLVMNTLDGCGPLGLAAGAVNGIRKSDSGALEGDLFDGEGFVALLDYFGIPCTGKRSLVIGAGGAAAAIVVSLAKRGAARISLFDPASGKAEGVAKRAKIAFPVDIGAVDESDPRGYDLVVNASPLGLNRADPLPCDVSRIDRGAFVVDILMKNQPTPFVRLCRERGIRAQPGFEMLILQAPLYLHFFGYEAAATAIRDDTHFLRELIYPAELLEIQ